MFIYPSDKRAGQPDSLDSESGVIYGTLDADNVAFTPSPRSSQGAEPTPQKPTQQERARNNTARTSKMTSDDHAMNTPSDKSLYDKPNKEEKKYRTPKSQASGNSNQNSKHKKDKVSEAKELEVTLARSTQQQSARRKSANASQSKDTANASKNKTLYSVPDLSDSDDGGPDLSMSSVKPVTKSRRPATKQTKESVRDKSRSRSRSRTPAKSGRSLNDSLESVPMPEDEKSPLVPLKLKPHKSRATRHTPNVKSTES